MTQSEKGYLVGLLKFKDLDNLGEFVENFAGEIADFFSEYDGKILVRTPDPHFLEGRRYDHHVIVEFEAFSTAKILTKFAKSHEKLKIIGMSFHKQYDCQKRRVAPAALFPREAAESEIKGYENEA